MMKQAYWIYENWAASDAARIHRAACGFCKNGKGCHKTKHGNRNGMWHGPYKTLQAARAAANMLNTKFTSEHACI